MNVASLRSADQANTSAECKLAKVSKYIKKTAISVDMFWYNWTGNTFTFNLGMSGYANTAVCLQVALMTIALWFLAWTPYLVTNYTGIFSNYKISPLATIWCSLFAKANAVYNTIVYGIRKGITISIKWGQCLKFLSASYSPGQDQTWCEN